MAERGVTHSSSSSGSEIVSGPIRRVLIISAGASHSVALLCKSLYCIFSVCICSHYADMTVNAFQSWSVSNCFFHMGNFSFPNLLWWSWLGDGSHLFAWTTLIHVACEFNRGHKCNFEVDILTPWFIIYYQGQFPVLRAFLIILIVNVCGFSRNFDL